MARKDSAFAAPLDNERCPFCNTAVQRLTADGTWVMVNTRKAGGIIEKFVGDRIQYVHHSCYQIEHPREQKKYDTIMKESHETTT